MYSEIKVFLNNCQIDINILEIQNTVLLRKEKICNKNVIKKYIKCIEKKVERRYTIVVKL